MHYYYLLALSASYDFLNDHGYYYFFPEDKEEFVPTDFHKLLFGDEETLYLDNSEFELNKNTVSSAYFPLVFDTTAFAEEESVCGTDCMNVLTRCWHDVIDTTSRFRDFYMNTVDGSIEKMANSINDVDGVVANSLVTK